MEFLLWTHVTEAFVLTDGMVQASTKPVRGIIRKQVVHMAAAA